MKKLHTRKPHPKASKAARPVRSRADCQESLAESFAAIARDQLHDDWRRAGLSSQALGKRIARSLLRIARWKP